MTMRVLSRCLRIVLVGVVAATALTVTPARAAGTSYAALGDSYSSGVGADSYYVVSGTCLRSSRSYPALWAAGHSPSSFAFAACGGATTDTVRSDQLGVLNSGTSLVTISVGGNDVGFVDVVLSCRLGTTAFCANAVASAQSAVRTTLPAKLTATYAAIRAAAPNARLVVLGYPRLFETVASCGALSMSQANRVALNHGADTLETVIKARAEAAGATYVSVQSQFEAHRICAGSPWINGTVALLVDSYHPNAYGYADAYLPALTAVTG